MSKGKVYDEEIAPLVEKIIEICMANKIAMLCTFETDVKDGKQQGVTSLLGNKEGVPPSLRLAADVILGNAELYGHEEIIDESTGKKIISDSKYAHRFRKGN